jgi:sec-independent protein translocase protein TatB
MGTPPPIEAANIGMWDSLILMVMALVVFGPRRLPQLARQLGKIMYEFRKASNDFKYQMDQELRIAEETDRRTREEARQRALTAGAEAASPVVATETPTAPVAAEETPAAQEAKPADPYAQFYPEFPAPEAFQEAAKNAAQLEEKKAAEPAPAEELHG